MANGRMITNQICGDKRINQLSSDTSRMAFTWLITFADREGRTHGDPAMVRSMLFPRRQDVTIEAMETMICEWAKAALIVWYECDGDLWIWFPNFDKNQPGLRKDKEAPSRIPEPTETGVEAVRSRYGVGTELLPVKLIKGNGIKENSGENPPEESPPDDPSLGDSPPTPEPTPAEVEQVVLAGWKKHFPNKPQPRAGTYRSKVAARWKSEHFRENWEQALVLANKSPTCQKESWFCFEYFIKNETNYQKMLENWMRWKDEQGSGQNGTGHNGNGASNGRKPRGINLETV